MPADTGRKERSVKQVAWLGLVALLLLAPELLQAQTPGRVEFQVTTTGTGLGSEYNPKNIMAIWVTTDSGTFVKTLKRRADNRIQYLYKWNADSGRDVVDAVTGATLSNHETHSVTWNCTDVAGDSVSDGVYRIRVEMTVVNDVGPFTPVDHIEFTKGASPVGLTPSDQTNFKDMALTYTPTVDPEPNVFVAKNSTWRFNDTGTDLHAADWKLLSYADASWGEQAAPLGYGGNGETLPVLGYGADDQHKYPCYYFRKRFDSTIVPESATVYLRRDDGVVVYLNGHEIARDAMALGDTAYSDYASSTAGGTDETTYFDHVVDPSFVVVGENIIVAEVHQANATSSDMGFDLQLKAANAVPVTHHDIAVLSLSPGSGVPGASVDLMVAMTNLENTVENVTVIVSNLTAGIEIGRQMVTGLLGHEGTVATIAWDTSGDVSEGTYALRAVAVPISGETRVANNHVDSSFVLRTPRHDVGILRVEPEATAVVGDFVPIAVTIENSGTYTEAVTVVLADLTSGSGVSTSQVSSVLPLGHETVRIPWPTLGLAPGSYDLQASIPPVPGETITSDNTLTGTGVVDTTGMGLATVGETASIAGHARCVVGDGTTAYAGFGAMLGIMDLTSPASPTLAGSVRLPDTILALAHAGTTVYAATGRAGVQSVNAQDVSMPRVVSTFDTSGNTWDVAVSQQGETTLLFVADGLSGLRILDVTAARAPVLLGAYRTEGPARAVAVQGTTLYLVDQHVGLLVLSVVDPTQPTLLGEHALIDAGQDIAVQGSMAIVVDGTALLSLVDVATPEALSLLGSLRLPGEGLSVDVAGTFAYVAMGALGLQVVDLSTPATPTAVATHVTAGFASGIDVLGANALVADDHAGLTILNVATPSDPAPLGRYDNVVRGADVALNGGHAFVAAGESGLRIYSMTNPALPALVGTCDVGITNARAVAVLSDSALVADAQFGLRIVDISTPSACVVSDTYTSEVLGGVYDVVASDGYAAVTDGHRIQLLNVANGSATALDTHTATGHVFDLAMTSEHVFAATGGEGLLVLQTSGGTLSFASRYDSGRAVTGVDIDGSRAYLSGRGEGWDILDVSNPSAPVPLDTHSAPHAFAWDVSASGDHVFVVDGSVALDVMNVATVATPVAETSFRSLAQAMCVASTGSLAFVGEGAAGVTILDRQRGDRDGDGLKDDFEQRIVDANLHDAIDDLEDVDPNGDFDGDGLSNAWEQLAGTDPTDPESVFVVKAVRSDAEADFTVSWSSQPGKYYSVHRAPDLGSSFQLLLSGIEATPPINTYSDAFAPSQQAFYLIRVEE